MFTISPIQSLQECKQKCAKCTQIPYLRAVTLDRVHAVFTESKRSHEKQKEMYKKFIKFNVYRFGAQMCLLTTCFVFVQLVGV